MGCDIHFHSEVKRRGVWQHHEEVMIDRNYALFAKMAGVRKHESWTLEPISDPRGIPEDATELTKLHVEKMNGYGHSHSWLNAAEIKLLHDFIKDDSNPPNWFGDNSWNYEHKNMPYFMGNTFDGFVDYPDDWAEYEVEDVRYIFFFDN